MIINETITYYHKSLNNTTKLEEWTKTIFDSVWVYRRTRAMQDKGYENSNNINVRIPMKFIKDVEIFSIGDIVAIGKQNDIIKQTDLKNIEFYNVTDIHINNFGNNPHIYLGGR